MKFIHLGDLHIGKSLGEFDLIRDQRYLLDQILSVAREQQIDAVILAGDIYDKSIPSEAAVRLFDYFLSELAARKIKTFVISGNHDSDERLHFGSTLFEARDIYISSRFDGTLMHRTIEDAYGTVHIWMMPFVKASQVRHFYPEESISTYEDAVRAILRHADLDPSQRNILTAHQFVTGPASDPVLGGSESAAVQNVGLVERITSDCFDDFDYVALGHIHSPQAVGRDTVRYSGSLMKYSLSEAGKEKSVPVITLSQKGSIDIELFPLKPMRDLRHIRGRMDQLLAKENISSPEDFIYATLTDETIINDAMGIFQQYYPNTVRIEYDNSHTRELQQIDLSETGEARSFRDLFSDFYRQIYGTEITEEELKVIREIAGEAGVDNEAD